MIVGREELIPGLIGRIDRAIATVEEAVASAALLLALCISLYAVFMRWARIPTGEWVLDLPVELLLVIALYGSGALIARRSHMSVVFALERLPRSARFAGTVMTQVLLTTVCAVLTSRAAVAAQQAAAAGLRRRELFYVSEGLLVSVSVLGIACWTVHAAIGLVHTVRSGRVAPATIELAE